MNRIEQRHIHDREAGQATIMLLLMLGTFLLAVLAFAVDLTNMWFHRQSTQTAADAACQAGAMDMLAVASGITPPAMGFTYTATTATGSDCTLSTTSTICKYAKFNGYSGTGFSATSASNSVSWTFPAAVTGATAPPSGVTSHPFITVTIRENIKTWFMALLGIKYQAVAASCTCGLSEVLSDPPIVVLNPSAASTLNYNNAGKLQIYGGPQRSIQVNSTNAAAVSCSAGSNVDTSAAGPSGTGGDITLSGGPAPPGTGCFSGGSTGVWRSPTLPVLDPYGGVPAPTQPALSVTASAYENALYQQDGCPDHLAIDQWHGCHEFEPGYYPSGLSDGAGDVVILKPGIYYMNGSFNLGGGDDVRLATPCTPKCLPSTTAAWTQTDGVMFYFISGSFNVSNGTGALPTYISSSPVSSTNRVDPVNSTSLTCNGSAPSAAIAIATKLDGNILVAQCSTSGTYVGAPSTDTTSSSGSRGLLVIMAPANPSSVNFSGGAALAFSGSIYSHSTLNQGYVNINNGAGTKTYVLGEIVSDNITVAGSGLLKMGLNPTPSVNMIKVSILQ